MKILYKNQRLEIFVIGVNIITAAVVACTFVMLHGFHRPLGSVRILHSIQAAALIILLAEKAVRLANATSRKAFFQANWYELPLLIALVIMIIAGPSWFEYDDSPELRTLAVGVYLVLQIVIKVCRTTVALAASGKNPSSALIISFLVLIISGAGVLSLPRSYRCEQMSFIDALFTATSATCVTGLVVKDTGHDFSFPGQIVILTLIQLGGLGIVTFGAVLALLLGQALTVRESVAMKDLLSTETLSKISHLIGFIFATTLVIESLGAVSLLTMWSDLPATSTKAAAVHQQWFYSIFHSISAFCNAGFSLLPKSLIDYSSCYRTYIIVAPLIILGGLGFGVLYDLFRCFIQKISGIARRIARLAPLSYCSPAVRISLQSKIVLSTSLILIIAGTLLISIMEKFAVQNPHDVFQPNLSGGLSAAFFQSVSARTAGFNTVNIASLTSASKFVIIILMFIGGSPGSSAGGIKTVTFTIVVMIAYATLRKRPQVELFKRSVPLLVAGRAITVILLFGCVFLVAALALSITERQNTLPLSDIIFETGSALGTVGLSTGITAALTTAGKMIIIITMLIGRLGPLTLLAAMTFNLKPAVYDYPVEPIIVG